MTDHPSEDLLRRCLTEAVTPQEQAALDSHLETCGACLRALDRLSDEEMAPHSFFSPDEAPSAEFLRRLASTDPLAAAVVAEPERISRYEVVRTLGRGGMGVVYLANDPRLNRAVAVKVLLPDLAADEGQRRRFVREARAASRVDDSRVVRVYDVGDPESSGPPYFVMEYIDGDTLADRLDGSRALAPGEAARVVEEAARGLAALHAHGLTHRDLKPSNLMLPHGSERVVITDLGLARPALPDGERITLPGEVVGTPAYMSPEHFRAPERVNAASDLYSLGVVLYRALTGELPFGSNFLAVFNQLCDGTEPRPPHVLDGRVPRDLSTICLKAMASEPARRYASALDLADDLERWRTGRPIRARPVGAGERALRWCRRRPTGAALILALVVGTVTSSTLWLRAERHRTVAEANADDARLRLEQAKEVVNECFEIVQDSPLLREARLRPVRQLLQGKALKHYQRLVDQPATDPASRREAAQTLLRLGDIMADVGTLEEALDAYAKSRAAFEELLRDGAGESDTARAAALCANNHGIALDRLGRSDEAVEALAAALAQRDALCERHADDNALARQRAVTAMNLATALNSAGRADEAIVALRRTRSLQEELRRAAPDDASLLQELAKTLGNIAVLTSGQGQPDDALRLHAEALALAEKASAAQPDDAEGIGNRAWLLDQSGSVERNLGRHAAARKAWEKALALREEVARREPTPLAQQQVARAMFKMGALATETGDNDAALAWYAKARTLQEALTAANPGDIDSLRDLAATLARVAGLKDHLGQPAEADRDYTQAVALRERVAAASPTRHAFAAELADTLFARAQFFQTYREHQEAARAAYRRSEEIFARLWREKPDTPEYGRQRARVLVQQGIWDIENKRHAEAEPRLAAARALLRDLVTSSPTFEFEKDFAKAASVHGMALSLLGRRAEAAAALEEARTVQERHVAAAPEMLGNRTALAETLNNLGDVRRQDDPAAAELLLVEAVRHQRLAFEKAPAVALYREHLSVMYHVLHLTRVRLGKHAEAAAVALERRSLHAGQPNELFLTACDFACCAPLVEEKTAERGRYVRLAVETLRQAVAAGLSDAAPRLRDDKRLDPLRAEEAFRALLRDAAAGPPPAPERVPSP